MKLTELYSVLEEKFPKALSCEWDNDGLMCASSLDNEVKKVLCVLDVTDAALKYAAENGFDTIISHHPMILAVAVCSGYGVTQTQQSVVVILHP